MTGLWHVASLPGIAAYMRNGDFPLGYNYTQVVNFSRVAQSACIPLICNCYLICSSRVPCQWEGSVWYVWTGLWRWCLYLVDTSVCVKSAPHRYLAAPFVAPGHKWLSKSISHTDHVLSQTPTLFVLPQYHKFYKILFFEAQHGRNRE